MLTIEPRIVKQHKHMCFLVRLQSQIQAYLPPHDPYIDVRSRQVTVFSSSFTHEVGLLYVHQGS